MAADIRIRRVYDEPGPGDGVGVLVDTVWPRGLRKTDAKLDEWARDLDHRRPRPIVGPPPILDGRPDTGIRGCVDDQVERAHVLVWL
jgi:uncharacterized protein DUF488